MGGGGIRCGFYLTITYWAGGGDRYKVWFLPDHYLLGWGGDRQIQGMVST